MHDGARLSGNAHSPFRVSRLAVVGAVLAAVSFSAKTTWINIFTLTTSTRFKPRRDIRGRGLLMTLLKRERFKATANPATDERVGALGVVYAGRCKVLGFADAATVGCAVLRCLGLGMAFELEDMYLTLQVSYPLFGLGQQCSGFG